MAKGQSPLVGYNNNVRHKGKLYHIQTEDSGTDRPHIITHLFADGGRIVASRKTDYSEHLGSENLEQIVRNLMKEQHRAMAIALRDCEFDEGTEAEVAASEQPEEVFDIDAFERAAEAHQAGSPVWLSFDRSAKTERAGKGEQYELPAPKAAQHQDRIRKVSGSIFGSDPSEEMSLDEVILGYLTEDTEDDG